MSPDGGSIRLDGRVAVVTGGTRGIGRAIARKLATAGADVHATYREDAVAAREAADTPGLKGSLTVTQADVNDLQAMTRVLRGAHDRHGRLDIVVHNVASWHPMPTLAARLDALQTDVATAVGPLLRLAPLIAGLMDGDQAGGRIVAVSSSGARSVIPQYVGLAAAKAALEATIRYLAADLAPRGISVNAVSTAKVDKGDDTVNAQLIPALAARTPGGRLTRPEDVADAVALLVSDEAGWIQGQVLTVDGGLSLRG
jgi:enoyl-[acyl-carrier protein] reductase III